MGDPVTMHEACLLCGSTTLLPLRDYELAYLVKCSACSFVFSGRKPTAQELTTYYRGYPRDTTLSSVTRSRYLDLLKSLEKYRKSNNLLDIGCGDGHFLTVAKERGWKVYGTEYTDEAVAIGEKKGITMRKGRLSDISFGPEFFDVVTSFEVIEHINDPLDEVKTIHGLLRPGGCCYITTPNFNSLSRHLLGSGWNVICYPEHLCYFTNRTIVQPFRRLGFRLDVLTTTGISVDRIRSAAKGQVSSAGMDESLRQHAERSGILNLAKRAVNFLLNGMRAGDTLKATFQKP